MLPLYINQENLKEESAVAVISLSRMEVNYISGCFVAKCTKQFRFKHVLPLSRGL